MRKGLRYTLITLAVALLLLVIGPFLVPTDSIRHAAEQEAGRAVGMPVTIGDLSLRFLPSVRLVIHDMRMNDIKGGTPKLAVKNGNLDIDVAPLLQGHVDLTGVRLGDVTVRTSARASGKGVHTIHIDKVTGQMRLTSEKLEMAKWRAAMYGGTMKITALVKPLTGSGRSLRAKVEAKGIHVRPLLKNAKGIDVLSGDLTSTLIVSARGADGAAMQKTLKVDGPVQLMDGDLKGVGLEGAAVALLHGKLAGDSVVFESLGAKVRVRGKAMLVKDILLQSSHLDATGQLAISPDRRLRGEIQTSGTAKLTGMKLLVAGTTANPKVYPAPSSVIGATIGGAVGGPLGAAAGAKAGGRAGNMLEKMGSGLKKMLDGK
ncbi:MAG TPA: AsmA family protein [Mariprofundaceae bacterium]|nr:AsmA family protein [Mariprofundaceae bacterium]